MIRHGARSPSNPYPTDEHQNEWPQGLDQLTIVNTIYIFK